jgi:uncharacterized protein YdhG (YjbR/CyaY superfamily)
VKKTARSQCRGGQTAQPAEVERFLAALPVRERAALRQLRRTIRSVVPDAVERISWRMPMFFHCGPLVAYAAFKDHCSLFGMSPSVTKALAKELRPYDTSPGTIRFAGDDPLPVGRVGQGNLSATEGRGCQVRPQ